MKKIILVWSICAIAMQGYCQEFSGALAAKSTDAEKEYAPLVSVEVTDDVVIDMVYIPAGTFMMGATAEQAGQGAADERPVHEVTLSGFYIATTECTQAVWDAVMGWNNSGVRGSNIPVTNVNVYDCKEFISALNKLTGKKFRLPTEAEWEYAARGGAASNATMYSGSSSLSQVAWYASNTSQVQPVAIMQPNELGLYDMSGNVYEICSDQYGSYSPSPQNNPTGRVSNQQVFRGGAYFSPASECRTTVRSYAPTDYRDVFIGFRLVMIP